LRDVCGCTTEDTNSSTLQYPHPRLPETRPSWSGCRGRRLPSEHARPCARFVPVLGRPACSSMLTTDSFAMPATRRIRGQWCASVIRSRSAPLCHSLHSPDVALIPGSAPAPRQTASEAACARFAREHLWRGHADDSPSDVAHDDEVGRADDLHVVERQPVGTVDHDLGLGKGGGAMVLRTLHPPFDPAQR